MRRPLRLALGLLLATLPATHAFAQNPSEEGAWTDMTALPLAAIHAVLLPPDGTLLLYSYASGGGTVCWTLDPKTYALKNYPLGENIFCGGQSLLTNGDALSVGGTGQVFDTGLDKTYLFDEVRGFTEVTPMARGRWYPTVTKLADGRFCVLAGLDEVGADNRLVEIFDPVSTSWQILSGADKKLPLYPMAFLVTSGEILVAGPHHKTEALDLSNGQWRFIDKTHTAHHMGCAVMLPPYPDRVMVMGGHTHGDHHGEVHTFKVCEILDLNDPSPKWRKTAPMHFRRQHHNAVLLPDGKVLALGGEESEEELKLRSTTGPWFRGKPHREAELFDPLTETWKLMAAQARPRVYHSIGILLRDGRVLTAGGDGEHSAEIFSPPYLFKGPRPSLTGVPQKADYGTVITVKSTQVDRIASACLMAPGAVTHSFCQNQRYVAVDVQANGAGDLDIAMPASATVAPPGQYMLFVLNEVGVPSVGRFLQLD